MSPLLSRTALTLRGRFEALRPRGPIPALMAETPRGHPLPSSDGQPPALPICDPVGMPDARWIGGGLVGPEAAATVAREVWLAGDPDAGWAFLRVCRDANGFVQFLRHHCGLPEECGTRDEQSRWIWTVFEAAEREIPFTLLRLDGGGVFRSNSGGYRAPEEQIAEAAKLPDSPGDFVLSLLRQEFDPTRYWQLADLIEASITLMDVIEVAISSSQDGGAETAITFPPPLRRDETVPERLLALWNSPEGRKQIFAAGSAEKIAMLVPCGKTAVVKAGKIWRIIRDQLKSQRVLARYHRMEAEDRRES